MNRRMLAVAIAIVLAANVFALIDAAMNRSGAPESEVELTERELILSNASEDNTGLTLRLRWFDAGMLEQSKLAELGFDMRPNHPDQLPKLVFAALERTATGLGAIDVAADPVRLRQRHPDRKQVIIARCAVRLLGEKVSDLLVDTVNVPPSYRGALAGRLSYAVTMRYGKHYEPWVAAVR
jgi:hypothetical protein